MTSYDLIFEEPSLVNLDECVEKAQGFLPERFFSINRKEGFTLPQELFTPLVDRSYSRGCDAGLLIDFFQKTGRQQLIIMLKSPLLSDEWGIAYPNGQRIPASSDLVLGRADKINKYAIVSSYKFGNQEQATTRASKILAHELAHTEAYLEDGCCDDERCILYNSPSRYQEIGPEVLGRLDRKSGWCDFHGAVLFPPIQEAKDA